MTETNRPWASIIIVNFNAGEFLQPALDAVAAQTDQDFELILVDNASTDGSADGLRLDHIQHVTFMPLTENTGFARGNNLAAAKARGEWLILLNPDTLAAPNWLAAFRAATRAHPEVFMFAGATIDMTDTDKLDGAGDCYLFAGLPWRGGYQRSASELPKAGTCFSPCGASAMFRRELFLEAGGFDERYFCYCEDVDLGFQLRLEGYECVFWPDAKAAHYGSASSGVASPFAVRHGTRNRLWTFVKNMPPIALVALLPIHFLLTIVLVLRAIPQGRAGPTLAGLREGVAGLGPVLKTRRAVQARRRVSSFEILKAMTWNPVTAFTRRTDVRAFGPEEDKP